MQNESAALPAFIKRINAKYHLSVKENELADIRLKPNEKLRLSLKEKSAHKPRTLETKDLDELKSWIGVPDEIFAGHKEIIKRDWIPTVGPQHSKVVIKPQPENMSVEDRFRVRTLTRDYLRTDSASLKQFKSFIEDYWKNFVVTHWLFKDIYVAEGAVLEIEGGASGIFTAHSIQIEQGGTVRALTSMIIESASVKKV